MDAALTEAVESKSYDMLGDLEKRVSQLAADRADRAELKQAEATAGGDLVSAWPVGDRFCFQHREVDKPRCTRRSRKRRPVSLVGMLSRAASGRPRVSPRSHLAIE
jgi:hypothetical protein